MGRPSNGVPYLKGGVYHIRFQGDKGGGTSLNTTNKREAQRLAENIARKRGATMPSIVTGGARAPLPPSAVTPGPPVGPVDTFGAGAFSGDVGSGMYGDALGGWFAGSSEFSDSAPPDSLPDSSVKPSASQTSLAPSHTPAGLSAEERVKMHGMLAGIVGRANVLALGLGVRVFGRVPAEPEPSDLELLNKAWALQLEEILGDKEIRPYVLILAASAGLGVGMWVQGEPIPPKQKGQPTATGAPLSLVP